MADPAPGRPGHEVPGHDGWRGASGLLTPLFALDAGRWERRNWLRMREWMAARPSR